MPGGEGLGTGSRGGASVGRSPPHSLTRTQPTQRPERDGPARSASPASLRVGNTVTAGIDPSAGSATRRRFASGDVASSYAPRRSIFLRMASTLDSARGPLHRPPRARPRRDGHGLPRRRPPAWPPGGDQGAPPRARRAARPRPVHPRDPRRRLAQPPAHPAALRLRPGPRERRRRRPALLRHALRARRVAPGEAHRASASSRPTRRSTSSGRSPPRWTTRTRTA